MVSKILLAFFLPAVVFSNNGEKDFSNLESIVIHPDVGLNVKQLIDKYGYPFENHTVQTEDGYLLELHRIPHGRNLKYHQQPPVLVLPGLFCSSADFVNMGPERSLGFILADQGYDVWLGNFRGTRWSRKHTTLNPDENKEFWDYSFHEMGYYDAPAFIDYILEETNHTKLYYVGHSQGTSSFFILSSTKPEYNKKIRLAITLAPVAYIGHMQGPFVYLMVIFKKQIEALVDKYGLYEVMPYNPLLTQIGTIICSDGSEFQNYCADFLLAVGGNTPNQLNKTMIPVISSNTPAGASFKQFQHFTQLIVSKAFRWYNYGIKENIRRYGQMVPPSYDLGKIAVPVAFYYGDHDPACLPKDVNRTASEIPNLVVNKVIDGFNHLDILWGIDVVKTVFNDVVELMKRF